MATKFRFLAQSYSPANFTKELNSLGILSNHFDRGNQLFWANMQEAFSVYHKSHCIEKLRVQIGHKFLARSIKELEKGMAKMPMFNLN